MSAARRWPRRAAGLPAGQRLLDVMPRFSDDPRRPPPPVPATPTLTLTRGASERVLGLDELAALGTVERVADIHCVTTWSVTGLRWTGVPVGVLLDLVDPERTARYARAGAADGVAARFLVDDLDGDDVIVATHLDDAPISPRHGAPLRLVSPSQYGYKNVKHLERIELLDELPDGAFGAKEHLRARVDREERHSRLPARLVRWPYRLMIPLTAIVADRSWRPR